MIRFVVVTAAVMVFLGLVSQALGTVALLAQQLVTIGLFLLLAAGLKALLSDKDKS